MTARRPLRSLRARLGVTTALVGLAALPNAAAGQTVTTAGIVTVAGTSAGGTAPTITSDLATSTTVQLKAGSTVLNWSSLNVQAGQTLNFQNLTGVATTANKVAVLNRVDPNSVLNAVGNVVTGVAGTTITGTINGLNSVTTGNAADVRGVEVWISNPNGILIGNGAAINTNGLVLTTLPIGSFTDNGAAFTGGTMGVRLVSAAPTTDKSSVTGSGTYNITTNGGVLAVVAPVVQLLGTGTFDARDAGHTAGVGQAAFVAATDVTMQNAGSPLSLTINEGTTLASSGYNLDVRGTVQAGTATMILSAQQFVDTLLNVQANVTATATSGNGVVIIAGDGNTNPDAAGAATFAAGATGQGGGSVQVFGALDAGTSGIVLGARSTPPATAGDAAGPGSLGQNSTSVMTAGTLSARSDGSQLLTGFNAVGTVTALVSTTGTVAFTDTVPLTIAASGAGVSGTGVSLLVQGAGNALTISKAITATTPSTDTSPLVGTLSLTAPGGINLGADVTAISSVSLNNAVTLTGDATVSATGTTATTGSDGTVSFSSTIDGGQALVVDAAGTKSFNGSIGAGTSLTSLTSSGAGGTTLGATATAVTTTGDQSYTALTLGADTVLNAGTGAVTFNGTINSDAAATPRALTVTTSGLTTFGGLAGNTAALASLSVGTGASLFNAAGSAAAPTVKTTGDQSYAAVTLGADAQFTGAGGGFGAITGVGKALGLSFTGTTSLVAVGTSGGRLASLTSNNGGTTTLGGDVYTSGNQNYADNVTLSQAATRLDAGAGTIAFGGTVGGASALTLASNATAAQGLGAGTGVTALTSLVTNGTLGLTGNVTTTGTQTYGGVVTVTGNSTLTGTGAATTFTGTGAFGVRPATSGSGTLTLDFSGTQALDGGTFTDGTSGFAGLVVGPAGGRAGATSVLTGDFLVGSAATFNDVVRLGGNVTVTSGGSAAFNNTVDSDATARTLGITANGTATFGGVVGGTAALASLSTGTGATTFAIATPVGANSVTTTGAQTYGATTLAADTRLAAGTGAVRFNGTIDSDATARALAVTTSGLTTLNGQVGNAARLTSLTLTGPAMVNGGGVATTGAQSYGGLVTLGADAVFSSSNGGAIGFAAAGVAGNSGGVDHSLTLTTSAAKTIANFTGIRNLTANGGGTISLGGAFSTSGFQLYGDPTTLSAATTLTSTGGGNITFGGTLAGAQTLVVNTAGTTAFNGAVSGLTSLTTDMPGFTTINADINVAGQTYNDAVTLLGTRTLTAGTAIAFNRGLTGTGNLTLAGAGTRLFAAAGGLVSLGSLTSNAGGTLTISGGGVTTTGDQIYTDAVALGANTVLTAANGSFASTVAGNGFDLALNFGGTTTVNALITGVRNLSTGNGGTTNLTGTIATTGTQTYNDAVQLTGATVLTSSGAGAAGDIAFGSTLDGAQTLRVTTAGTTTFGGAVGGTAPGLVSILVTGAGGTAINGGSVTTSGSQSYTATTLGADTVLTGTTIGFTNGVTGNNHDLTLTASGGETIDGSFTGIRNLTVNGGGPTTLSGNVTTSGGQTYSNATTLGGATVLTSTGAGAIGFGSTLDGGATLEVDTAGVTAFNAAVGSGTALTSITTNMAGSTSIGAATVRTTGAQTYNDVVVLAAAGVSTLSSTAAGDITFAKTVDATASAVQGLAVNTGGITTFGDVVGGTALSQLTTDIGGTTRINAGTVTTTGLQGYGDAVTLGTDTVLTSSGSGSISFTNTVDGARALVVNTGGQTAFGGGVGGGIALTSLTTDAGGTTAIDGGAVKTSGAQLYNDQVSLGADTVLTGTTGAFNAGLIGNGHNLTLIFSGASSLDSSVTGVNNLTTDAPGGTTLTGTLTTTGSQTYNDPVTLAGATTLNAGNNSAIAFAGTVNGAQALSVNTGGTTTFGGLVGGSSALASLATDAGGVTAINGGGVATTGGQSYGDAVTLGAAATLSSSGGGAIGFANTVDGAQALTVKTAGLTSFVAAVGGINPLASLTTDLGGTTAINGGRVTTSGAQTYGDGVTLGIDTILTSTAAGPIMLGGTVDGNARVIINTSGVTTLGGLVGGTSALMSLTTDTGGATVINGGGVRTTGGQSYGDAVTLGATTLLSSSGSGAIGFANTVNGAQVLTVNTGGATSFAMAVGGSTALASLTTDAAGTTAINGGAVTTTALQNYNDAVTLGANTVLSSTGSGAITLANTVNGAQTLAVNTAGATIFGGAVGGTTALTSLTTDAGGTTAINGGGATTTGAQSFGDAVTLGADTRLTSTGGGTLGFAGTVDGAHILSLTTTGAAQLGGVAGGTTALTGLALRAGSFSAVSGNRVGVLAANVAGGLTYDDAAALTVGTVDGLTGITTVTSPTTVSAGGPLTLASNVAAGNTSLTGLGITQTAGTSVNSGAGTITLDGRQAAIALAGSLITSNATANAVRVLDASDVSLGPVTTGAAGTVTLGTAGAGAITGNVTQGTGATIATGTLVGVVGGSTTLTNTGNSIATLGSFSSNGFALRDARTGLNVTGPVNAGTGNLALTLDAGTLALQGNLVATNGTVSIVSGGPISQTAGGITAAILTGSAVGGVSLPSSGNAIGRIAGFTNTGGGGFTLADTTPLVLAGDVTASGNLSLTAAGIDFTGRTISASGAMTLAGGSGDVTGATATAGTSLSVTGAGVSIGTATASNGALTVTATGSGRALTLGTASATGGAATLSSQGALNVTNSLTTNAAATLTAVGAATLGQTTAATNIAVTANGIAAGVTKATNGTLTLTSGGNVSLASGQAGTDVAIDASGTATLGAVTAGTASGITIRALDAQITGAQTAARVTFVNRSPGSVAFKLGNGTSSGGFQLSQDEVNLVNAGALTFDGGSGNVEFGALAFNTAAGGTSVNVLSTGRIDVLGAVSGSGTGRLFRLGGTTASTDDKASVIQVVATPAGAGGSLLLGTADLDLRGARIGAGQAAGFLTTIGFNAATGLPASTVATGYVANAVSSLYNSTYGGAVYTPLNPTILSARTLTVRYTDYALFQNTGGPGINAGVVLGGTPSAPVNNALTIQGSGSGGSNAFALFGTINGISGTATALLGGQVIVTSNANLINTRVNGCLVGSGAGCLTSVVSQPVLNVFDASQLNVFRSADDLILPFDPVVGGNNEALFSGVEQLDVSTAATDCAGHDDPQCRQPEPKDTGKTTPSTEQSGTATPAQGEAK